MQEWNDMGCPGFLITHGFKMRKVFFPKIQASIGYRLGLGP
jgi:hypothetical protein